MKAPNTVLKRFEKYTPQVDAEIKKILAKQPRYEMYAMMEYFFGYRNEELKKINNYGGKHFRSGISLLLADFYKTSKKTIEAATAIEIFHNFTLIHDDIADCDPIRRGRPSVWKLWGINHGINTGDAQLVLANLELISGQKNYKKSTGNVIEYLNQRFLEVAEGQFLDFNLADNSIQDKNVNADSYLKMITKKSGVLVGASARVAGMIAGLGEKECSHLWEYGVNLGIAYQLHDDLASIWGNIEETGKVEEKDIEERKKTLPIIYAFSQLSQSKRKKFIEIYDQKENLSHDQISEIKNMLSEEDAHEYVWKQIQKYLEKSKNAIDSLSIKTTEKELLHQINSALIPANKCWESND